jgi:hypothetical protein
VFDWPERYLQRGTVDLVVRFFLPFFLICTFVLPYFCYHFFTIFYICTGIVASIVSLRRGMWICVDVVLFDRTSFNIKSLFIGRWEQNTQEVQQKRNEVQRKRKEVQQKEVQQKRKEVQQKEVQQKRKGIV